MTPEVGRECLPERYRDNGFGSGTSAAHCTGPLLSPSLSPVLVVVVVCSFAHPPGRLSVLLLLLLPLYRLNGSIFASEAICSLLNRSAAVTVDRAHRSNIRCITCCTIYKRPFFCTTVLVAATTTTHHRTFRQSVWGLGSDFEQLGKVPTFYRQLTHANFICALFSRGCGLKSVCDRMAQWQDTVAALRAMDTNSDQSDNQST